jgi:transposase
VETDMLLDDRQWEKLAPLLPVLPRRPDGKGRPWTEHRACGNGILWVLKTGARWKDLPALFPPYVTCWRRMRMLTQLGVWEQILSTLLGELDAQHRLDWRNACLDASFSPAKKGVHRWAKPSVAKAPSGC